MPVAIRPIVGFPYCPPNSFLGQGITLAGLNEIISSIKLQHNVGRLLCRSNERRIRQIGLGGNPSIIPACGFNDTGIFASLPGAISVNAVGEILPGYDRIMIRANIFLPAPSTNFLIPGSFPPAYWTFNDLYALNVKFTLTNNVTGVSAVIGHFFNNLSGHQNLLSFFSLPAITTDPDYCTSIGEVDTLVTFIADTPATILPTAGNYADYCTIKCEVLTPVSMAITSTSVGAGVRWFSISQIKTCT